MKFLDTLKSIYFNFRYLPLRQAIYLPIWITSNFKVKKLKRGQIILDYPYRRNFIFGASGSPGLQQHKGGIYLEANAKLRLHAMCVIGQGTVLRCDRDATIELGPNFYCNKNCFLRSTNSIKFGSDCSLGWNVQINTSDGHTIWHGETRTASSASISIGNHVWLTSNSIITKGINIAEGCIVAQGSIVTKSIEERNTLIGGIPARLLRTDVKWEK